MLQRNNESNQRIKENQYIREQKEVLLKKAENEKIQ
jgi:hypothetical protein